MSDLDRVVSTQIYQKAGVEVTYVLQIDSK